MVWRDEWTTTITSRVLPKLVASLLVIAVAQCSTLKSSDAGSSVRQAARLAGVSALRCPQQVAAKFGIVAKVTGAGAQAHSTITANGVSALSSRNVWVAGEATVALSPTTSRTSNMWGTVSLIEHWDGAQWCIADNTVWPGATFNSIVATSSTDGWAAGSQVLTSPNRPLIEHWDGRRWTWVSAATTPRATGYSMQSVAASSPTNVWVIGTAGIVGSNFFRLLVERWDGHVWRLAPSGIPDAQQKSIQLYAVTTRSPTDTWIVGEISNPYPSPFALHWDGHRWQQTALPPVTNSLRRERLNAVAALSAHDVWAVGSFEQTRGGGGPIAYHWDGVSWRAVAVPNEPNAARYGIGGWPLGALAAVSATDIWAIDETEHALHWNGRGWHVIAPPGPPRYGIVASAASAVSTSDVWAVGPNSLIADHWDGTRWGAVSIAPVG